MDSIQMLRKGSFDIPNNNVDKNQNCNPSSNKPSKKCLAVQVSNAVKSYSNGIPILKNFNMNVQQGTIYGLLGASGCGKTTILSCIVGINKLDCGDIFVFGRRPGSPGSGIPGRNVGYMPQEISLYPLLTIEEILQYFGQLYGMTNSEIDTRIECLTHFLDLPSRTRQIGSLSGGQSRRCSLAASLLHEPPLLILDEPTVGVDPLLRESIWNHLLDLVTKRQTTVIITTHYIEETRGCNTIGLMRSGRLLVENCPNVLLEEHNVDLLEDIVLRLCKNDIDDSKEIEPNDEGISATLAISSFYSKKSIFGKSKVPEDEGVTGIKFKRRSFKEEDVSNNRTVYSENIEQCSSGLNWDEDADGIRRRLQRIRALVIRNTLLLCRNPLLLMILLGLPIMDLTITNLSLGPLPKNLRFGVVNPEISNNLSLCSFNSNSNLNNNDKCNLDSISCRFIEDMPNEIVILESMNSVSEALENVQNGNLWGYMSFPPGYTNHTVDRIVHGIYAEQDTLQGSTVDIRMDMSSYFAGALIQKSIYESFQKYARKMLSDCDQDPRKADLPLNFRTPVYGSYNESYSDSITAAVMMIMMYYLSCLFCSTIMIEDRRIGTLDRTKMTGVAYMEIMISFMIVNGFIVVVQTLIIYTMIAFVLQTTIQGSSITYIALLFINGLGGLTFGLTTAEIFYEHMEAVLLSVALFITSLSSCGIVWDLAASPYLTRIIAESIPYTRSIAAIRSIQARGWGITHPEVYYAFMFQFIWIVIFWIVAVIAHRVKAN